MVESRIIYKFATNVYDLVETQSSKMKLEDSFKASKVEPNVESFKSIAVCGRQKTGKSTLVHNAFGVLN